LSSKEFDARKIVEEGVSLFNEGRFWHCHEALERVWLKESGDTKQALQGIILVAAAFHHQKNRRSKGMLSTMRRGLQKLEGKRAVYGIDVPAVRETVRAYLAEIEKDPGAWLTVPAPKLTIVRP
jgi:hypothetical protein